VEAQFSDGESVFRIQPRLKTKRKDVEVTLEIALT
jgi:hypothetical protein